MEPERKYYERIDINGDPEKLPKSFGTYECKFKKDSFISMAVYYESFSDKHWLKNVEYYLLPVSSPDSVIVGPSEENVLKVIEGELPHTKTENSETIFWFNAECQFAVSQFYHWYRSQCKAVNLKDELVKFKKYLNELPTCYNYFPSAENKLTDEQFVDNYLHQIE